ncbi:MAG TPA: hypothetical protein V6C71_06305 [Coleofasciculaceae cyanobacterium]|jgi:hypothetical protein
MTIREKHPTKISFPFDLYFKQLFSTDTYVRLINPFSFWHKYRNNHLETCCQLDIVEYLERCHQIEWRRAKLLAHQETKNFTETSTLSCFPFRQIKPNMVFIFQPSIKLKYRGVIYQTQEILGININHVKIDPGLVNINSVEQPLNADNINTPEKSGSN